MDREDLLIYDIETDSLDILTAKCKWFGAYSYLDKEYYLIPGNNIEEIKKLLFRHSVLIGFNNVEFDNPIIINNYTIDLRNKTIIDLYQVSKKRLPFMGIDVSNFKLKTIIKKLGLDEFGKGDIDYKIFQKDNWGKEEIIEIKKYLKQDLIITKELFDWFKQQFNPLRNFLSEKDKNNFVDIKSTLASLSYRVICNLSQIPCEFADKNEKIINRQTFDGAHHIEPRWNKVKGNIVSVDFVSAYPHALMMANLFSADKEGWDGNPYFKLKGKYNNKEFGKVESALQKIFLERLKAKKNNDKEKNLSYKICINSIYGLTGNSAFKTLYNPITAGDCTSIVRTWVKKLAKTLEENGFNVLYGFTDNVIVLIPEESNKEELMFIVNKFIEEIKLMMPFPQDTFKMEIDKEIKFIWFVSKNCYLWVNLNGSVEYKSTLLNTNTPKIIMKVFNEYMAPKISRDLDINFSQKEIVDEIKKIIDKDISMCAEEYNCQKTENYAVNTSLEYQISQKYGDGKHFLIPNLKNIGVGKEKSTKRKIGVRYCSIEEFNKNNLTVEDIDISQLLKHIKLFINKGIKKDTSLFPIGDY